VTRTPAGKSDRRRRDVSTTRSTAGAGYDFEDDVAAWLLAKMLAGEPMPGVGGRGSGLQFQTAASGWRLDDLLVTSVEPSGVQRLALSCKASVQVTANGFPSDFAAELWAQLDDAGGPFNVTRDAFGLATQGRHAAFDPLWRDLKAWTSGADDGLAIDRIRNSRPHLRVFDSLRRSGRAETTEAERVALVRRLHVLPLDLQTPESEDLARSVARCRAALVAGTQDEAERLWTALKAAATQARLNHGEIEPDRLWAGLIADFGLKDHPDHAAAWARLAAITADYRAGIEAALPSGASLPRVDARRDLAAALSLGPATVLHGDSGVGKSALAKCVLEAEEGSARQVWLGPEALTVALGEASRANLGLALPLSETLRATGSARNILVLDAIDKLDPAVLGRARDLLAGLPDGLWRILLISQSEGLAARLQTLLPATTPGVVPVGDLALDEVKAVLRDRADLAWLTAHDESVRVLTNLRTLAWVSQAGASLAPTLGSPVSHAEIADSLWRLWTGDDLAVQSVVMGLAVREAAFERSFTVSSLGVAEASVLNGALAGLPMHKVNNRLAFDHDLAADWARFQVLKEISDDVAAWSAYAANPLWGGALRLLGQFLLRQVDAGGRNRWDTALAVVETETGPIRIAADVLFDALCLDPEAERFLEERTALWLVDDGRRLDRLLRRFLHIATGPKSIGDPIVDPAIRFYLEAQYRTPIADRWPPVARYLASHETVVAALISSAVAETCGLWLSAAALQTRDGAPFPFRRSFASLALATARALQAAELGGVIFLDGSRRPILIAALRGAPDLPEEVSAWAREVAGRAPVDAEVEAAAAERRGLRAAEQAARDAASPEARTRAQARRSIPRSVFGSPRRLPPWPLGPVRRVSGDFRHVVLHRGGVLPLAGVRPETAMEVVLAALIEDEPRDDFGDSRLDRDLGLEFDTDGYPAIFWKSPFFVLLAVAQPQALDGLMRLVEFCTGRWREEETRFRGGEPWTLSLTLSDGSVKPFHGDDQVFAWAQDSDLQAAQLHCALDALERWLCIQIELDRPVEAELARLLAATTSVAVLGVLVNVAKCQPVLLRGILRPLLSHPAIFDWDDARIRNRFGFDGLGWISDSKTAFEAAQAWVLSPHRKLGLVDLVIEQARVDDALADWMSAQTAAWHVPGNAKRALEQRILAARLDRANYQAAEEGGAQFVCPPDLAAEVGAFQTQAEPRVQEAFFPLQADEVMRNGGALEDSSAADIDAFLDRLVAEDAPALPDRRRAITSAAALLIVAGGQWLSRHPVAEQRADAIIREEMKIFDGSLVGFREVRHQFDGVIETVAYAVSQRWIDDAGDAWDRDILLLLLSGHLRATSIVTGRVATNRDALGDRWWRLLQLGTWASSLVMLAPRDGDEGSGRVWERWVRRWAGLPLRWPTGPTDLDFEAVQARQGRLLQTRWKRDHPQIQIDRMGGRSLGLADHLLQSLFAWLVTDVTRLLSPEETDLLGRLWTYTRARLTRASGDRDEYPVPSQFARDIMNRIVRLSLAPGDTSAWWRPVLSMGPKAHYALSHFANGFFFACDTVPSDDFVRTWRAMLDYSLSAPEWTESSEWYHRQALLRQFLGLEMGQRVAALSEIDRHMTEMRPDFARWAAAHLTAQDDNIASLCSFLISGAGRVLRLDGLQWLAAAFRGEPRKVYWRRGDRVGEQVVGFINVLLTEERQALLANSTARDAVMAITADLAARQVTGALTLQERLRDLR